MIWKENLKNKQNVLKIWTKCNAVLKSPVTDATQNKVDRQRAEKTEGIQRAYNMAVSMLRGDV